MLIYRYFIIIVILIRMKSTATENKTRDKPNSNLMWNRKEKYVVKAMITEVKTVSFAYGLVA